MRSIKQHRIEQTNTYYIDEMWINEGYVVQKMWQDKEIISTRQGHMEGWSTGIKVLFEKGKILIIVHIGSEDGFLKKGLFTFQSNRTGDHHNMNADVFEDYVEEKLKYFPDSVVIMDQLHNTHHLHSHYTTNIIHDA